MVLRLPFLIKLVFEKAVFGDTGKPEYPQKNLSEQKEIQRQSQPLI